VLDERVVGSQDVNDDLPGSEKGTEAGRKI
jgi:hypothetical protein